MMSPKAGLQLVRTAYNEWSEDKASRLAAALAYYTAFSVAPLVLIAIAIAGLVLGEEAAQGQIFAQLQGLLGPDGASVIETAVANSRQQGANALSAIVGIAMLVWSASNVFAQLQDALNTIWEVEPKPDAGLMGTVKKRFLSMSMVLGIGFLLLVSLVLSAALAAVGNFLSGLLPGGELVWQVVEVAISFGVVTLLFAAIYKILPDVKIAWNDVWIGAAVTALLFTVGKLLIGLYLGHASVGSTFGAAGSLLVLLVWVYYSAQILFFGAEFTQVYARTFGTRITPTEDAVRVTEATRAKEGLPHTSAVEEAAQAQETRPASAEQGEPAPTGSQRPARQGEGRPAAASTARSNWQGQPRKVAAARAAADDTAESAPESRGPLDGLLSAIGIGGDRKDDGKASRA